MSATGAEGASTTTLLLQCLSTNMHAMEIPVDNLVIPEYLALGEHLYEDGNNFHNAMKTECLLNFSFRKSQMPHNLLRASFYI